MGTLKLGLSGAFPISTERLLRWTARLRRPFKATGGQCHLCGRPRVWWAQLVIPQVLLADLCDTCLHTCLKWLREGA